MNRIQTLIPQRPPFLFVDEVIERSDKKITAQKFLSGDEDFFQGHFPDLPIMPGVLLCEAMFQTGALLISSQADDDGANRNKIGVVTRIESTKFKQIVQPACTLLIEVELKDRLENAFYMKGLIRVEQKVVATSDFTCTLIDKPGQRIKG